MAPKERLPISRMAVNEIRVFKWREEGFENYRQMYYYLANRCSKLRKTTKMDFSMLSLPEERVLVRREN